MKKRICAFFLAMVLVFSLVPSAVLSLGANTGGFTPVSGWDMMERLGVGYTFGNTTEAIFRPWRGHHANGGHTEDAWGQPRIEQWHFQSIAMKGFDSYRLCVTWTPHMDENYRIDPAWMDRIQQLVDWALDAGLYVILNTHHEEELYWLMRDGEFERAERHLNAIWEQVAARFANYPEQLLFEIINEPNLTNPDGSGPWIGRDGHEVCPRLVDITNRINASALNVIRNSGGNNAQRVAIWGVPGGGLSAALPYMEIPDDPYVMLASFGYYSGHDFDRDLGFVQDILDRGIGFVNKEDNTAANWGRHQLTGTLAERTQRHFTRWAEMGVPSIWFAGCASIPGQLDEVRVSLEDDFLNRVTGEWNNNSTLRALFAAYGKTLGPDFQLPEIPRHTIYTRSNVTVTNRQNPWEGVDIARPAGMNFSANDYIITVSGRVTGAAATTNTTVALNGQDAPWFWLSTSVSGNNPFTITANMGATYGVINAEQFANGFRVQTAGCTVDFVVDSFTIERVGEAPAVTPTPTPTPTPTVTRPAG